MANFSCLVCSCTSVCVCVCVCMCVCVCVWGGGGVWGGVRACVRACVRECVREYFSLYICLYLQHTSLFRSDRYHHFTSLDFSVDFMLKIIANFNILNRKLALFMTCSTHEIVSTDELINTRLVKFLISCTYILSCNRFSLLAKVPFKIISSPFLFP